MHLWYDGHISYTFTYFVPLLEATSHKSHNTYTYVRFPYLLASNKKVRFRQLIFMNRFFAQDPINESVRTLISPQPTLFIHLKLLVRSVNSHITFAFGLIWPLQRSTKYWVIKLLNLLWWRIMSARGKRWIGDLRSGSWWMLIRRAPFDMYHCRYIYEKSC